MFEKLDSLNWKTLEHAYGSADDAPGQIRNLVSQTPDDRDKALSYFWCKVIHQGTVCSAAPRTIPFLLEIIESPLANNRAELLEIICALASASTCAEYPDNKPSVIGQCRLEVAIGWQKYLRLLASTDECERCSVALALGHCKEHATAIVDALKSHIIGEKAL